ncbi:hypothetical protein HF086_004967 [Spodoptera exigua]|uniref:Uncharacterized protein n=1 Tax=Spodoptera exigua TaxID=7107 RepID=A0A922M309_SPOEX|nr:hypothetical protein HF086_004967 [Spodoptera exigua]
MDSVSVSFNNTEEQKPIFTLAGDQNPTSTTGCKLVSQDSFTFPDNRNVAQDPVLSSMTPMMQGLGGSELLNMLSQQEPRAADYPPAVADMEDLLSNIRLNGSDMFTEDANVNNYFSGFGSRSESASSSVWPDAANAQSSRNSEMMDTFDFLVKSSGSLSSRRRVPPSTSLLLNGAGANTSRSQGGTSAPSASPVSSPANPGLSYSSLWTNFGLN